jgi:hypothetical protein
VLDIEGQVKTLPAMPVIVAFLDVFLALVEAWFEPPPGAKPILPISSSGEDWPAGTTEAEASFQTHARGVLASPVRTQTRVNGGELRVAERMMFMVPPCAVRADTPEATARGADLEGQHESSVGRV